MRTIALSALVFFGAFTRLASQERTERDGLTLGVGVAAGTARVTCPLCGGGSGIAPSLQFKASRAFGPRFAWGIEANGWMERDREAGVRDVAFGVGFNAYWYLSRDAPRWFVKGGVGPLWYRVQDAEVAADEEPNPAITSTAVAGHFGVGLEAPAGPVHLVPFLNYTGSLYGSLFRDDTRISHARVSLMQVGVAISWR